MNTTPTVDVALNTELAARFMSVCAAHPEVAVALSALVTDAVEFALGEQQQLDAEAAMQSFIQSVQELRLPCADCRGWGEFQASPTGTRYACDSCSGRGWTWRNGTDKAETYNEYPEVRVEPEDN